MPIKLIPNTSENFETYKCFNENMYATQWETINPISQDLMNLSNVYIKNSFIIKYGFSSNDPSNIRCILKTINNNNPFNMRTCSFKDAYITKYGFSERDVHKHIEELKILGENVIREINDKIYIFSNSYYFMNYLKTELNNLININDLDIQIIMQKYRGKFV